MSYPFEVSASAQLVDRSLQAVWHPCTQMQQHLQGLPLLPIERGEGVWLIAADGIRYLDGISSWWVNLFGHAHPHINAAINDQLGRIAHTMLAGITHEPAVALAEALSAKTGGVLGHTFFASDGASAVEIALKMSHHYWRNRGESGKDQFLCIANSYHGETIGALGVTDVSAFRAAYRPLLRMADTVTSPDTRTIRPGESASELAKRAATDLEAAFRAARGRIAAFILEPLCQCAGGFAMYHPDYLRHARRLCDQYGALLIADEIAVGMGRSGSFFAYQQAGIAPDLLCLSKGLSGGYLPLSVVLTTDAVYEAFLGPSSSCAFLHSHSFSGNPLACRAALATLELFERDKVLNRNQELAAYWNQHPTWQAIGAQPQVRHPRNLGMIWAFDVEGAPIDFSRRFFAAALKAGAVLRPIGNTVYAMPPYVIERGEIDFLLSVMQEALTASLGDA